jgi:hypothetical protein
MNKKTKTGLIFTIISIGLFLLSISIFVSLFAMFSNVNVVVGTFFVYFGIILYVMCIPCSIIGIVFSLKGKKGMSNNKTATTCTILSIINLVVSTSIGVSIISVLLVLMFIGGAFS